MNNDIQKNYVNNILLGDNSYFSVVCKINEYIKTADAKTIQGTDFLSSMYNSLNESITPILTLRPFISGGEKLASDDITIKDVLDFIKSSIKDNADLNFLINLCKEEHFTNMLRTGHPNPKSTVQIIEKEFNKTHNQIKDSITNGIFDNLRSSLLGHIKKQLGHNENQRTLDDSDNGIKNDVSNEVKDLKENNAQYNDSFVRYNPIGFMFNDTESGKNLNLVENEIIIIGDDELGVETVEVVPNEQVKIPQEYQILINAVQSLPYNPKTNQFTPRENWDFDMKLNTDGTVQVQNKEGETVQVATENVKPIFIESIKVYDVNPSMAPGFVRERYMRDADNFIAVMNNANSLIRFNNLEVVRNINESISSNNYVIIHKSSYETPKIMATGYEKNLKFESYKTLCESCNNLFGTQGKSLFESIFTRQLDEEMFNKNAKIQRLSDLNEEQSLINEKIKNIRNLRDSIEINSPAYNQLNEQESQLLSKLNENLEESMKISADSLYN